MERHFQPHLDRLLEANSGHIKSREELKGQIQRWYNGYAWAGVEPEERVFNPYSINSLFLKNAFAPYWATAGLSSALFKLARQPNTSFPMLLGDVAKSDLGKIEVDDLLNTNFDIRNLLLQMGYLSAEREYLDGHRIMLSLKFPNLEVEEEFPKYIWNWLAGFNLGDEHAGKFSLCGMSGFLEECNNTLRSLAYPTDKHSTAAPRDSRVIESDMPPAPRTLTIQRESGVRDLIHVIALTSRAFTSVSAETHVQDGRLDLLLQTTEKAFVLELKMVPKDTPKGEATEKKTKKLMEEATTQVSKYTPGTLLPIERYGVVYSQELGLSWKKVLP